MRPLKFPALVLLPAVAAALPAAAVDFEKEILPILESKCVKCHHAPYEEGGRTIVPKAGLRMDAAWAIQAGGDGVAIIEAGDPDKSELYLRVTLPAADEDFMPPTGEADPLTEKELASLKAWITEGADFGEWVGNLEGKPEDSPADSGPPPLSETQQMYARLGEALPPTDSASWAEVIAAGGRVKRLSTDSPLLEVDFRLVAHEVTGEQLPPLDGIAAHIAHLDLSKTAVADGDLAFLQSAPNLVRLDLSRTAVGDGGLRHLLSLGELRHLNLFGSRVSDKGIEQLKNLENLEAVYLWQTKVTPAGARKLQEALPNARVNFR